MTTDSKKDNGMCSKMHMFLKMSTITAVVFLAGWLFYSTSQSISDEMKGNTSWKRYQEGHTQDWKQSQYVDAILSAPGIRSRANRYAVLRVQEEINEDRFQKDQKPIAESGVFNQETLFGLVHLPIENLENILNKPELGISNGYDIQIKKWNDRKKQKQDLDLTR